LGLRMKLLIRLNRPAIMFSFVRFAIAGVPSVVAPNLGLS